MKKIILGVLALTMAMGLGMMACSSGGGDTPTPDATTALINSYTDFGTIMESGSFDACFDGLQTTCNCPGGGNATFNQATLTITLNNCKSAAGKTYTGSFTLSQDMTTASASFTTFGDCASGTATGISMGSQTACQGEITASCAGSSVTCPVETDPTDPNNCTLVCS